MIYSLFPQNPLSPLLFCRFAPRHMAGELAVMPPS